MLGFCSRRLKWSFIDTPGRSNLATSRVGKHESVRAQAEKRRQHQHATTGQGSLNQDTVVQGRTSAELQAAENLARFAQSDANSQLSGDRVEELVRTLYVSSLAFRIPTT